MIGLLALAAFVILALPIALLAWNWTQAVFASALLTALFALVAVPVHVATGIPMAVAWLGLVAIGYGVIGAIPALRHRVVSRVRTRPGRTELIQLATVALIVTLLTALPGPPTEWDARSIWLFQASWLNSTPDAFLEAQSNPALLFAHPGYPLLAPASVATVWSLAGGQENLVLGMRVIAVLTVLTGALAASTALDRLAPRIRPAAGVPLFVLLVGATVSVGAGLAASGYVDALQAATVVFLLALLLTALGQPLSWRWGALATLAAIAAVSVKQEGMWFTLAVLLVYGVVTFRHYSWATALPFAGAAVAFGVGKVFAAAVGSPGETDSAGVVDRLSELLDPSSPGFATLRDLVSLKLTTAFVPAALVLLTMTALLIIVVPSAVSIRRAVLLAGSWAGLVAIIAVTYSLGASSNQLQWWLDTSYDRITATPALILWFTVFSVIAVTFSHTSRKASAQ